jgi:hypothetical protein
MSINARSCQLLHLIIIFIIYKFTKCDVSTEKKYVSELSINDASESYSDVRRLHSLSLRNVVKHGYSLISVPHSQVSTELINFQSSLDILPLEMSRHIFHFFLFILWEGTEFSSSS